MGCREVAGKRGLVRIVRTPEGGVELDPKGKRSGRGAYIHPAWACVEAALKGKRLERALKVPVTQEAAARLKEGLAHAVDRADLLASMADRQGGGDGRKGAGGQ